MTTNMPRHLLSLTRDEKKKFLDSFDLVLSDCDGVVWHLSEMIKDVGTSVQLLKDAGKKVSFVTNNSVRSQDNYLQQFNKAEINTDINELVHPSKSIVEYLKKIEFQGLIYCIGTQMLKGLLKEAGYEYIDGPNDLIAEDFGALFKHVFEKQPVKAVVIDIDFNLSATKLIKADHYLKQKDCILVAGATDMVLPLGKFGTMMGPGPYVRILEESSKKVAKTLGKPGKELGEIILDKFKIKEPKRVLFIGDMLEQDVGFGKMCGFQTLLVLTGGTTKDLLIGHSNPKEIPDVYADRLGDFIEFFTSLECKTSL